MYSPSPAIHHYFAFLLFNILRSRSPKEILYYYETKKGNQEVFKMLRHHGSLESLPGGGFKKTGQNREKRCDILEIDSPQIIYSSLL